MAKIYKRTDRIKVQIDDITLQLAPLSLDNKVEIQSAMIQGRAGSIEAATKGISLALKYSIKGISGIEDQDGAKYELNFDDQGNLSDDCVDDLFNLEMKNKLILVCSTLANSIPDEFTDENGEKIDGVSIIRENKVGASKN